MYSLGNITFIGSGIALLIMQFGYFIEIFDSVILTIFLSPLITPFFPFIYWIREGDFPLLYLGIWLVGFISLIIMSSSSSDD